MSTKIKGKSQPSVSLEEANAAAQSYAMVSHGLKKKEAAMAEAIAKVKAKHEIFITEAKGVQLEAQEVLEAYAEQTWHTWQEKSTELAGGITIGYRTGPWAVKYNDGANPEEVVAQLKEAGLRRFLRIKEEVDKPAILKEKNESVLNQLAECHVSFEQSETFFIKIRE